MQALNISVIQIYIPIKKGEIWKCRNIHLFPNVVDFSQRCSKILTNKMQVFNKINENLGENKCHSHYNKGFFIIKISIYSLRDFLYLMQIPAFYLFCRKSSNIFEKNLRTRSSGNKWIFLHSNNSPF